MRRRYLVGGILLLACGCQGMNNTDRGMLTGGLLGGGLGTVIGGLSGHPGAGAAIGAGTGALVGGLAGNSMDKQERRDEAAARAYAAAHPPLSIADIVRMSHDHVGDDLIVRQMEATGSVYNLSADDITYLRQNGVSERVVSIMISRRAGTVVPVRGPVTRTHVYVVEPPPPPVSLGFGFGYGYGPRRHRCW
jgi:uncharacterized protein YcfJ